VNIVPRPTDGRNESGVGAMHPSGEANSSGMTGPRQRRAVPFKGGIAHSERVAPANGCASPIVNIVPRPTDGRNESGVGAMHPSGEVNSSGMTGPRQRRAVRFKGGIARGERIASANGWASPIVNVTPRRNGLGVGAMHPSGGANSSGMAGPRQRRAVRCEGGIAHCERVAPANGRSSPIVNVSPRPADGRSLPRIHRRTVTNHAPAD